MNQNFMCHIPENFAFLDIWVIVFSLLLFVLFALEKLTVSSSVTDLDFVPIDCVSSSDLMVCRWFRGCLLFGGFICSRSAVEPHSTPSREDGASHSPRLPHFVLCCFCGENHIYFLVMATFNVKKNGFVFLSRSIEMFQILKTLNLLLWTIFGLVWH